MTGHGCHGGDTHPPLAAHTPPAVGGRCRNGAESDSTITLRGTGRARSSSRLRKTRPGWREGEGPGPHRSRGCGDSGRGLWPWVWWPRVWWLQHRDPRSRGRDAREEAPPPRRWILRLLWSPGHYGQQEKGSGRRSRGGREIPGPAVPVPGPRAAPPCAPRQPQRSERGSTPPAAGQRPRPPRPPRPYLPAEAGGALQPRLVLQQSPELRRAERPEPARGAGRSRGPGHGQGPGLGSGSGSGSGPGPPVPAAGSPARRPAPATPAGLKGAASEQGEIRARTAPPLAGDTGLHLLRAPCEH